MYDLGKKMDDGPVGVTIGAQALESEDKVYYPSLYVNMGEGDGKLPKLEKEGYAKVKYRVASMTMGRKNNSMELEILGIEQCDKDERPRDISDAFDEMAEKDD